MGSVDPPPENPSRLEPISSTPVHSGRVVHLSLDTVRYPDGSTGELEMIRGMRREIAEREASAKEAAE